MPRSKRNEKQKLAHKLDTRRRRQKYKYDNSTKAYSVTIAYLWMLAVRGKILKGHTHGNSPTVYIRQLASNNKRFYGRTQEERRARWARTQKAKKARDNLDPRYVYPGPNIQSYMRVEERKKQKRDALNAVREDLAKWESDLPQWNSHFYKMLRSKRNNSVKNLRSLMVGRGTRTVEWGEIRHETNIESKGKGSGRSNGDSKENDKGSRKAPKGNAGKTAIRGNRAH